MIACYLQKLTKRFQKRKNIEWEELRLIVESQDSSALNDWLGETARLALSLENNFKAASNGQPTQYCMKKTVDLEDNYRRSVQKSNRQGLNSRQSHSKALFIFDI